VSRVIHAQDRPSAADARKRNRRRGELVELMRESEGWQIVAGEVQHAIDRQQAKILNGDLAESDYRYHAGILRGLTTALECAEKLARQAHGGPDDGDT
jgi:hypothetical protein